MSGSNPLSEDKSLKDDATSYHPSTVDTEKIRQSMCKMVISAGLSLATFQKIGFRTFTAALCPRFELPTPTDLVKDALKYYKNERKEVEDELQRAPGRICFTVDNMKDDILDENHCMCLVAHWIDRDWNPQQRMIKFETLFPPFDDEFSNSICDGITSCLAKWKISSSKVFSFTIDEHFYCNSMMDSLKAHFLKTDSLTLDGRLFHVKCAHEMINLVVVTGLKLIECALDKIRNIVGYIASFPSEKKKFYELAKSDFGLDESKRLINGSCFRWNSTFAMLDRVLYFKDAIDCFLKSNEDIQESALTQEEWETVSEVFQLLKFLYSVINARLAPKTPTDPTPTPNVYFHVVWIIFRKMSEISNGPSTHLSTMAKDLHSKFEKYWNENVLILSCATVLDPRYKLERVEYCYEKLFGEEYAKDAIQTLKNTLFDLFKKYLDLDLTVDDDEDEDEDYMAFLSKKKIKVEEKSELERYLEDWHSDINKEIDVLAYWKENVKRFPRLSCMARDVLTVPVSTIALKSVFSTSKNFNCIWRKSLPLQSVNIMESLVLYQDWLRARGLSKDCPFYGYEDDDDEDGSDFEYEGENEYKGEEFDDEDEEFDDEEEDEDEVGEDGD